MAGCGGKHGFCPPTGAGGTLANEPFLVLDRLGREGVLVSPAERPPSGQLPAAGPVLCHPSAVVTAAPSDCSPGRESATKEVLS